jgi:3-phosphoshikimate 1-carboxyvinyltransferase
MRIVIRPGSRVEGETSVPGDKSIAHRWLILAATADGPSRLVDLPTSLDVRSTARCLSQLAPSARPSLEAWARNDPAPGEGHGSTWNSRAPHPSIPLLKVQGEGRAGLVSPERDLDCGNAGTAMRMLSGVAAGCGFRSVLTGDASLSSRPMERVADPLRLMGAKVATSDGHAPLTIDGGDLHGIDYRMPVASAQVKGAILLAALTATGSTTVRELAGTRDHTERALRALGAPVDVDDRVVRVGPFQHAGFEGRCPGDPSSAAFLVAAAALSGSALSIVGVGLNPTRLHYVDVMRRMGVRIDVELEGVRVGEPVGSLTVGPCEGLAATVVDAGELPLVVDEVPVLALLATHAAGRSRFMGAGELRIKESDRLEGIARGIESLGGRASAVADGLEVVGSGLGGGTADPMGDHRMAMAFTVGSLAARGPSTVEDVDVADVSFPGFVSLLTALGADLEETR